MMRQTRRLPVCLLAIVCALLAFPSRSSASHGTIPQDSRTALAQPLTAPSDPALLASEDEPLIAAREGSATACVSFFSFAASGSAASEGALLTFEPPENAALRQYAESGTSALGIHSSFAASAAQVLDSEVPGWAGSCLQHLIRNRYFSPELGRFLQPDPMGYADSTNLYQGFGNNPANMVDPLGLESGETFRLMWQEETLAGQRPGDPNPLMATKGGAAFRGVMNGSLLAGSVIAVGGVLTMSGVLSPAGLVLIALACGGALATDAAGNAHLRSADRYVAGLPSSPVRCFTLGVGDTLGPTRLYEGLSGKDLATGQILFEDEAIEQLYSGSFNTTVTAVGGTLELARCHVRVPVGGSTYQQRLQQTPVSRGWWSGHRGESAFYSYDSRANVILKGGGIQYSNARPDFSSVAIEQVEITGMSIDRRVNFKLADEALSRKLGIPSREINRWRVENKYTWHEVEDLRTMQLVPTGINSPVFKHLGGVGEISAGAKLP